VVDNDDQRTDGDTGKLLVEQSEELPRRRPVVAQRHENAYRRFQHRATQILSFTRRRYNRTPHMSLPDLASSLLAASICALVFLFPGYAAGWLSGAFAFRTRVLGTRIVIAVLLSFCVTPILAWLSARFGGSAAMWVLCGALMLLGVVLFVRDSIALRPRARAFPRPLAIFAAAWCALASLALLDVVSGDRLFQSVVIHDFVKHVAVTNAITRTGVPP